MLLVENILNFQEEHSTPYIMLREEHLAHIRQVITSLKLHWLTVRQSCVWAAEELDYLEQLVKEDWQSRDKS